MLHDLRDDLGDIYDGDDCIIENGLDPLGISVGSMHSLLKDATCPYNSLPQAILSGVQHYDTPILVDGMPMIRSFKDKATEAVFAGKLPKSFPADLYKRTRNKLLILNAVSTIDDLKSPPGNMLEALERDRAGQHSIRVNDQFRIASDGPKPAPRMSSSPTTIDLPNLRPAMSDMIEIVKTFGPVHPGAILREEFIEPLGLTAGRIAKGCGLARTRIERIVAEEIGISGDTAIRLGRFFRTTPQFWMNLQQHYELERAAAALGDAAAAILPFEREAA